MGLKEWIIKKAVTGKLPVWMYRIAWNKLTKKKGAQMLDKLKEKLSGNKTYVTIIGGLIFATIAVLFGPIDLPGPVDIPYMPKEDYFKFIWEGVVLAFLRMGVKKSGPEINKQP